MKNFLYLECSPKDFPSEYQFFVALLKTWGLTEYLEIVQVDGNGNLPKFFTKMQKIQDQGGKNLIVFDGDEYEGKKGCKAIREKLLAKIKEWNEEKKEECTLNPEIFLMPDDQTNGCVETLMECTARKKEFLSCFECYIKCLEGHKGFLPNLKAKIFAYGETCIENFSSNKKREGWAFLDENLWDLEVKELQPLKEFLTKNVERRS